MLIFYSSVADVKTRAGVAIFTNWIHFFSQRPQRKLTGHRLLKVLHVPTERETASTLNIYHMVSR